MRRARPKRSGRIFETPLEDRGYIVEMRFPHLLTLILFSLSFYSNVRSEQEISPEQLDFFETHVRPNLIKYCYECHSVEGGESRGGLYLDTREGMLEGGSTGPLFDEEKWEYSLFVDAITWDDPDFEMPPKKKNAGRRH